METSLSALSNIPLDYPSSLDGYVLNVVHYADESSPLLTEGKELIAIDAKGTPRFHSDAIFFSICVKGDQEQGGRTTISYSRSLKEGLVMADAEGNLPQWKACMVHSSTDWLKSGGEMCTTIDMSALSKWEYKQSESQEDENV